MRIGIDFDNTIVSYDTLFHKVARERNLVPPQIPVNKLAVRDHLRRIGQEDHWTAMQGYVYGARMDEALAYDGVIEFMHHAASAGHQLFIVSHKTRKPFLGPEYDLHAAARAWIERHILWEGKALLPAENIFFELTKQEKLNRIEACGCDTFIDDLPEILLAAEFPQSTHRLLFDPEAHHEMAIAKGLQVFRNWQQLSEQFSER
ncbi:MAG: haloacid dehalogenase-like hydrolase [Gammaproteobacteria bacterium]|nr:haloacid dehalogenase-like hydrolase [Gammaproteobacteria bacterium]